jgi:hypothetical protein
MTDAAKTPYHNCEDKNRLLMNFSNATVKFSQTVLTLHRMTPKSTKEEFRELDRTATEARINSERARVELEQHIAEHGC